MSKTRFFSSEAVICKKLVKDTLCKVSFNIWEIQNHHKIKIISAASQKIAFLNKI